MLSDEPITDDLGPEGHVVSPLPDYRCANSPCRKEFDSREGAYLHKNRETSKLLLLCPGCSLQVRLHDSLRLPLVAL